VSLHSSHNLIYLARYYQDPLHILLRYIAEVSSWFACFACTYLIVTRALQKEPNCDMAVVHDDDLGCIDGMVWFDIYQLNHLFHVCSRSSLIHLWVTSATLSRGLTVVSIWQSLMGIHG
jgi:hypothetical protein